MIAILSISTACAAESSSERPTSDRDVNSYNPIDLPALHRIRTVEVQTAYSCDGDYETSAVFLTRYSEAKNAPDLLLNGTCNGEKYIHADTAGDDFALISDLGKINLKDVTASKSFNFARRAGMDNSFKRDMPIKEGHAYAVLTSKSDIRSLVIYKVVKLAENGAATLKYVAKSYSLQEQVVSSPGFSWKSKNY